MAISLAMVLKAAPFAAKQLEKYRRSDPYKMLNRRVRAAIENDSSLGQKQRDSLINEWFYLHNDPRAAVLIYGLLRDQDVVYLEALRVRSNTILDDLDDLALGKEATVERLVALVSNNFVGAQKDVLEATQASVSATLSALEPLARREDVGDVMDALAQLQQNLLPAQPRVLLLPSTFDENQQRHLEELRNQSEESAGNLGQLLGSRGVDGLVEAVTSPPAWAESVGAAFWRTSGRILIDAGRLHAAQHAFEREAESVDVEDRVGALVNAARCAEDDRRDDSEAEADRLFDEAGVLDAEHPAVKLFLADRPSAPEERLALTDAVEVTTPRQLARKEQQRALALMGLQRYAEAREAAQASAEAQPHGGGRELLAMVTILEANAKAPRRDRDDRPLMDAIAYQLSLYEEARAVGRSAMAGVTSARAALGAAALGDRAAARELIDRALSDPTLLVDEEARSTFFEASLNIADAERARGFVVPQPDAPEERLQAATVKILDGSDQSEALADLDALLKELPAGPLRDQTAMMRVLGASDPVNETDPSVLEAISERDRLLAHAAAGRALNREDYSEARTVLLTFDDPATLSMRVDIAERAGQLPEAIGIQSTLTRREPSAQNLLRLASLRARTRDFEGAIREAMRLATDHRKFRSGRDRAFEMAAQAAIDLGAFDELEDITDRWAELSPDREDPLWAHTYALARQDRHGEALAYAKSSGLKPTTQADRHLLWAELLMYGIEDAPTRLRSLLELSDSFGRPLELERALIGAFLKTEEADREGIQDIVSRFQEAMLTFEERFPDSGSLVSIKIDPDEDGESIAQKIAAVQGPESSEREEQVREAIDGVSQGRMPVSLLAGLVGRGTAEVLIKNGARPLAIFAEEVAAAESAAADKALDEASASWDETAILSVADLTASQAARIESLLPGSLVGQTVRNVVTEAVRLQMGGERVGMMRVLPDGRPQLIEEDSETVAHIRRLERAADDLATRLNVISEHVADADDKLARTVSEPSLPGPSRALASALLVARSKQCAVYSDDRAVRAFARGFGIPAFGTLALIDAAVRRGLIGRGEGLTLIEAVLDLGVWSIPLTADAHVGAARRAGFDLSRCGRALLGDELLLSVDPRVVENACLLAAIATEAPTKLDDWAKAMIMAYDELVQLDAPAADLLLGLQFEPGLSGATAGVQARNMAVARALRDASSLDPSNPASDPLRAAIGRWLDTAAEDRERADTIDNLLSQVDEETAAVLRAEFANGANDDASPEG
jgi:hypothetical protein